MIPASYKPKKSNGTFTLKILKLAHKNIDNISERIFVEYQLMVSTKANFNQTLLGNLYGTR
jgi:hypothetical protein